MPRLYFGSRGGQYYKKNGRKVYVKRNRFGSNSYDRNITLLNDYTNKLDYYEDYAKRVCTKPNRVLEFILKNIKDARTFLDSAAIHGFDETPGPRTRTTYDESMNMKIKDIVDSINESCLHFNYSPSGYQINDLGINPNQIERFRKM
jgi:hypothetical protein